ncbi:hypothetical protein MSAN_02380200 [Mycena sanguinolenta]|uniref:Uncharacterized protein n=1 Tax=Mycena sanguinolenta TaxID=230812 RepID=A0A8H6X4K4_9AGAR|nr:hypothetical protein MSAN_02380200 [Mycena sanguinolenta]
MFVPMQPSASQLASGSGWGGQVEGPSAPRVRAGRCISCVVQSPVIVSAAMCTAFEIAKILADRWDVAIASSASSSRIFIVFSPRSARLSERAVRSSLRARRSAQLMWQAADILASPAAARSSTSNGEFRKQCRCSCGQPVCAGLGRARVELCVQIWENIAFTSRAITDAALRITTATPPAISLIARLRSTDDPEAAAS